MTAKANILRAIREKCLDCSCHQPSEIRDCKLTVCPLWPYRLGRDPEPSRSRGFAKPFGYTGDLPPDDAGGYPDPTRGADLANAPATREVLTKAGPSTGNGLIGEGVA